MNELEALLNRFKDLRVLVVGDVMLDRYLIGGASRISPEAPVPVVNLQDERLVAGGAANVAANIKGLQSQVHLVSVLGADDEARSLKSVLEKAGIDSKELIESENRVTTVKSRILAHGQQLARLDRESNVEISGEDADRLISAVEKNIPDCDALLLSDYGKGIITSLTSPRLITIARDAGIPVFVDPKGSDYSKYAGASVLTPNQHEASEVYYAGTRKHGTVEEAGTYILESLDIEELVITLGADGMAVFPLSGIPVEITSTARNVFDVTGAGDTVISVIALAKASGASLETACVIGNTAAGMVVEKVGTTAVDFEDLKKQLLSGPASDTVSA